MGRTVQPFTKEIICSSQPEVPGKIFSELGSKHRVKRRDIKIKKIEELKSSDVSDPVVKQLMTRGK
jgi:large subunit ribosomal protein LX